MRIRVAVPDGLTEDEEASVINHALETNATAVEPLIAHARVPTAEEAIREGRVRWRPEPPGDEHFDPANLVMRRGWGDCDDLAPWHAASLRVTGEDPEAFPFVYKSGRNKWHAVVQRSDGSVDDPSRLAGMGGRNVAGIGHSALWRPMFADPDGVPRAGIATHPWNGGWAARVDAPWVSGDGEDDIPIAYSAIHTSRSRRRAVVGALGSMMGVMDQPDYLTRLRLAALRELLSGVQPQVVGDALEEEGLDREQVGDLLGSLLPAAGTIFGGPLGGAAGSMAAGLLKGGGGGGGLGSMLGGLMGGGGGGGAPAAVAPGQFSPGMGTAPGTVLHSPGGPIIVRF